MRGPINVLLKKRRLLLCYSKMEVPETMLCTCSMDCISCAALRVVLTANLALVLKMLLRSIRAKKVLPKMALLAMVHGMHW